MARSEARFQFGMWQGGLDGLSAYAKLVYAVLLTESTVNHAGIGAMRVSLWARDASLTVAETHKALDELRASRHVVIDENTEEILVRTLLRHDRVAEQPYVLKGALKEALLTRSPMLRLVLASELRKLPPKQPDGVSRKGGKVVYPDPHAAADQLDPPTPPEPEKAPETLLDQKAPKRVSEGSITPPKSLRGGGGGGGGGTSSYVGTQLEISAGAEAPTRFPEPPQRTAQRITKTYYDREPMSKFPAVMAIVKKALAAGHEPDRIEAALLRLAEANRTVTVDSLRIELNGPPLKIAAGGRAYECATEDDYRADMWGDTS